jgi:putative ABC transport system substrate-binding protein
MARNDPARRGSQPLPTLRRRFNSLLVGLLVAVPHIAVAQRSTAVRRIGRLETGTPDTPEEMWIQAAPLRELGWIEGQNLHVERRYGKEDSPEELKQLAEDLLRAKVEIIVTVGTPATRAAMRVTRTIPIVFRQAGDPVGSGLVASLARPRGNVTGFSWQGQEVLAKYLSLVKELLPGVRRIGVLEPLTNPYLTAERPLFENLSRSRGIEPIFVDTATIGEIDDVIAQLARQHIEALVLRTEDFVINHQFEIVAAATKYGLPTLVERPSIVREAGALASYFSTSTESDRRTAYYIDRILRGAKPADLPVEQPTQFELVINLKTARALGLTIPASLLLRADEVIR